ncbi:MAG: hypothetical protein AVDCRST_MAG02-3183 [uncultured Rubrobacteraceae bacterium]|uniref:Uncharacterized protein n=1 Tax=uncultured Rubrobacteraceae bacterium TaxID=349277 RepID=A0A6J4R9G1_9ACTN|nr:MAG: hypothetical protein AVDCRST_MAG02-3183 [uncultured Rubrobacteraceae bacterium]
MVIQPSVRCHRLARATFQTASKGTFPELGRMASGGGWCRPP